MYASCVVTEYNESDPKGAINGYLITGQGTRADPSAQQAAMHVES